MILQGLVLATPASFLTIHNSQFTIYKIKVTSNNCRILQVLVLATPASLGCTAPCGSYCWTAYG